MRQEFVADANFIYPAVDGFIIGAATGQLYYWPVAGKPTPINRPYYLTKGTWRFDGIADFIAARWEGITSVSGEEDTYSTVFLLAWNSKSCWYDYRQIESLGPPNVIFISPQKLLAYPAVGSYEYNRNCHFHLVAEWRQTGPVPVENWHDFGEEAPFLLRTDGRGEVLVVPRSLVFTGGDTVPQEDDSIHETGIEPGWEHGDAVCGFFKLVGTKFIPVRTVKDACGKNLPKFVPLALRWPWLLMHQHRSKDLDDHSACVVHSFNLETGERGVPGRPGATRFRFCTDTRQAILMHEGAVGVYSIDNLRYPTLNLIHDKPESFSMSHDGMLLGVVESDGTVRIWDVD